MLEMRKTFDALVFAENSCWVFGRSGLFEHCADIARRGGEAANALDDGPVKDLIQIQFLQVRSQSVRKLKGDSEADPLYEELRNRVADLSWKLTADQIQMLERDAGPFPPTPSSQRLSEDHPLKIQIISNSYDAFNSLYLVGFFEQQGARVDWRHHSDTPTPELAPAGYALSIVLGGPLSPNMFPYTVEFKGQPGFMDLYRVDLPDAYDVFKLTRNNVLCCLAAGATKFLTTKAAHKVTLDSETSQPSR